MSKGALLFAHNNPEIDYVKIAAINALMIQKNLKIPVSLVTDHGTHQWAKDNLGKKLIDKCFDNISIHDRDYSFNFGNERLFKDTSFTTKKLPFYNPNRYTAFELSPYDETLLIDADYLIMSDALSHCWGSKHDIMLSYETQEAYFNRTPLPEYVDDLGIRLYWATVVYFNKTVASEQLFTFVEHIVKNYDYYRQLYAIPERLYRNDFAFSIAIHMMNGFRDNAVLTQLPFPKLLKVYDNDDIYTVNDVNDIIFYMEKPKEGGSYILNRVKNHDVHVMNKWSILRHADSFFELYG